MARYRRSEMRWVPAACVAGGYLVCVAGLFTLHVGAELSVPISVAIAAPPLVYAALAMLLLREAPFVRRLSWLGAACLVHVLLGGLAATELAWAGGLSLARALAQVFVLFPPALVLTLIATPLTLAAFGRAASSMVPRVDPSSPRPVPTPARSRPLAAPLRTAPATAPAPAAPVTRPPAPAPVAAPTPVAVPPAPAAPVVAPSSPPTRRPPSPRRNTDDGMVRVPFARIAAQLPAEAFVLPFERLAESLREPHTILVPRRVVLSQLQDGAVVLTWGHIASQFPDLALGVSDDEFRKQYPHLKVVLSVDELASQLPAGIGITTAAAAAAPVDIASVVSSPPVVVPPAASPELSPRPATPAPDPPAEVVDRQTLGRIAACFGGVATFEIGVERALGTAVVALVEPGLPREAAVGCASRVLPFIASDGAEIVTVRTERVVLMLAAASRPIVVAACRPGAPVALLTLRTVRAAAIAGGGAPAVPGPRPRDLRPAALDGRATEAALALRAAGGVESTVFADGPARAYVFNAGARDDKAVAALALGVCDALGDGGDLGRVQSIVFRRGSEHTLVRPLVGGGVLAATDAVMRAGRMFRDADRAATVLETP